MTAQYKFTDIIRCMRISARMLEIADPDNRRLNDLNCKQAELLRAAADDLEVRELLLQQIEEVMP